MWFIDEDQERWVYEVWTIILIRTILPRQFFPDSFSRDSFFLKEELSQRKSVGEKLSRKNCTDVLIFFLINYYRSRSRSQKIIIELAIGIIELNPSFHSQRNATLELC